jgi:hypothetical protein
VLKKGSLEIDVSRISELKDNGMTGREFIYRGFRGWTRIRENEDPPPLRFGD